MGNFEFTWNATQPQANMAAQEANQQANQDAARVMAVKDRIARNEARIAELRAKLQSLPSDDELDRQLAANRASRGDIGTAVTHLNRIDSRTEANRERARQNRLDVESIDKDIRNVRSALAYGGWNDKQLGEFNATLQYLMNKRKELTGVAEPDEFKNVPVPNPDEQVSTTDYKTYIANNTERGLYTTSDARSEAAMLRLKAGGENAAEEAKKILNTLTKDEHKAKWDAKYKRGAIAFGHLTKPKQEQAKKDGKFTDSDGKKYTIDKKGNWYSEE